MAGHNKYHSRKVIKDGEKFDSVKEYKRFCELLLLEKAGEVTDLKRQLKFVLIPAQYEYIKQYSKNGKQLKDKRVLLERETAYFADFVYRNKDGRVVVEDTKGVKTKDYIIKRKLMLHVYGIKVKEI